MKFCKIQKADFFIFWKISIFDFTTLSVQMYGLKKEIFLFCLGEDLLHFFSLKNSQKLYKWGVTICQKFVRCKVRGIKIFA